MGLHINSINGIKSASGYELFVLTFGLSAGSPEFRTIQENFAFMAEKLGARGVVITGGYDKEFGHNFAGFLGEVEDKLFSTSMLAPKVAGLRDLPVPALVVLKKDSHSKLDLAYLSILNFSSEQIIATFRSILEFNNSDNIENVPGNLLARRSNLAINLWNSIQIRPNFFGLGMDVKELLRRN